MSKNNVRIAIRDSTDSHNVAFFDNKAGIKYKSANLQRFLAGSASILTLKYNSKDIDSIRSGCKLAFRYKNRDYWLNVMSFEKKGYEVELTAYSLGLELNNETRGEHKPANAMSIAEYVAYYDPEHALTIGVNEVSDKRIKLEWTGTDTILARLFSVANSFDAELDFSVELNDDYSLKRQVLNIYKKGNLGTNKVSQPVRVGKELKVINYSDNIKELRTAVRATGKDGLTIDGLNKKIYDDNKELLYYSSGMTVYAPQSRDRFPSVGKSSNDNWIVKDLGETQYETKEALWGYMYGEIQKISVPEITYEVEGAIDAGIGDTQTLIDDKHFEPALYVQARVSELEDDILTGKVTKSTFINFERKYSQIADELQKRVNELVEASIPYTIKVSSDNGTVFKNATGTSTFKARVFKGEKEITSDVTWRWSLDGNVTTGMTYTVKGAEVTEQSVLTVAGYIGNDEVATTEIDVINVNDGADGAKGDKGETGNGIANTVITYGLSMSETTEPATWASNMPVLVKGMYLWTRTVQIYTNGKSTVSYQKGYIAKDGAQGLPGTPGKDAQTQYTHIAYADNATGGGFSLTDNTKDYWGMYQDFNAANSNDPTKYKWSKWKGDQGLPGAPGADGKTPYIHFAYADDNKGTNLSFTDKNQQYQGYYSDYTEANSTDYKKYTWVDRLANVQVGGVNLLTGTRNWSSNIQRWSNNDVWNDGVWNDEAEDYNNLKVKSTTRGWNGWHQNVFVKAGEYYTLSYYAKADTNIKVKNSLTWEQSPIFQGPVASFDGSNNVSDNITTEWKRYSRTVKITGDGSLQWRIEYDGNALPNGKWYIAGMKLERGNIATDWSPAPEDTQSDIDSKADQTLTQDQLNALTEKNNLIKAEMEAKASIDTVDKWIAAYENYVKANDEDKAKSEQALKEASERIVQMKYEVNDLKLVWEAIDRFMSFQNEGLIIGKKDGSAYAKFSDDRISLFSGSSEVMYISQGTLNIANGIFTKTIQIGRFRFETHPADADMLVVRFLGG